MNYQVHSVLDTFHDQSQLYIYSIPLHISPTFQSSGIESGHVLETWIEDTAALRKDRKEQSQIRKMRKIREKKERMQQGNLLNMDLESVNHFLDVLKTYWCVSSIKIRNKNFSSYHSNLLRDEG